MGLAVAVNLSVSVRGSVPALNAASVISRANERIERFGTRAARLNLTRHNRSGETTRELRSRRLGNNIEWYDSAPGGFFLETGTKPHIIRPTAKSEAKAQREYKAGKRRSPHAFLAWEGPAGSTIFAREVHHPGTKARPWLAPAIEDNAGIFEGIYEQEVMRDLDG